MKMLALALVFQLLPAGVVGDNSDKLYLYTKTGDQHTLVGDHSSLLQIEIVGAGGDLVKEMRLLDRSHCRVY